MTARHLDPSLTSVQHVLDQPRCAVEVVVTSGAVVGQIISSIRHPNADLLWVVEVDIGPYGGRMERKLTIVHGGTRSLCPGDLVPVAPPGARLSTGKRIRIRSYRGQRSEGMCCSTTELGWVVDGPDEVAVLTGYGPGSPLATGGAACPSSTG